MESQQVLDSHVIWAIFLIACAIVGVLLVACANLER